MESRRAEILKKDAEREWNAVVKRREADLRKKIDAMGVDANESPRRVRKE